MNVNFHDTPRHMLQIRQITLPFTKRIYQCAHVVVKNTRGTQEANSTMPKNRARESFGKKEDLKVR